MEQGNNVIHFRSQIGGLPFVCAVNPYTLVVKAEPIYTERHSHSFYELLYIADGEGSVDTDDMHIPYQAGFVCFVAPYVYHTRNTDRAGAFLSIKFEPERISDGENDISGDVSGALAYLNSRQMFTLQNHARLSTLFGVLICALEEQGPGRQLVLSGTISAILSVLMQEALAVQGGARPARKSLAEESSLGRRAAIIDYFFDQVENADATMDDLCSLIHVSPGQLNRIIRARYGKTFKQMQIDKRIEYIKHLLAYTDYGIPAITVMTNFSSESNLSQFFKQHCGRSPTAYRIEKRSGIKPGSVSEQA